MCFYKCFLPLPQTAQPPNFPPEASPMPPYSKLLPWKLTAGEAPLRPAPPVILSGATCGRACGTDQWGEAGAGAWVNKRRGAAPGAPPRRTPNALARCLPRTERTEGAKRQMFIPIRSWYFGGSGRELLHIEANKHHTCPVR